MKYTFLFVFCCFMSTMVFAQNNKHSQTEKTKRTISINFTMEKGPLNTMFNECVGAGRANEGLRADWQQQLAYVKEECGFRYIRMHIGPGFYEHPC